MADDDTHSSSVEDRVRAAQVEARARHISHNVRCLECGHQSIEESAADIAVRLRKVIRDDIRAGKTDNEIYERLTTEYGETILYSPAFDAQTAVLWLGPVAIIGAIAGATFYRGRAKQRDVGRMADALFEGIPLTPSEHRMLKSLVLPPSQRRAWTWPSLWKL
ncbi:cytochrome c-type biogenesis CcmH-like mitochondrial protein isoform X1 [Physcomitrium patens]|uniref:Cytochrome c-type biogenesis protein n=1 Tax=Physcomitrium patens TaxID=3218 RepID=A9S818_PHYPA|nr:cytochrome c-type biogenesis CcmH-like mitochondrial protein isoform X1 [Physcomitrium patens]XP_024370968.1 cytochrome c-type biogenesis CcmH-like mitochondrial protein isoform X1 [Physcomitrium patens]XP_024370969.1 cytochrome c-type biogenesis CcmH-like mitochondrial protein isoform X1 [Physcomitrium patens]XP_024370970.1 cytochrome c-type biogenesis CcmH-like mitochondrial protein isoform X1 [Physcomitrium patens]XP_024370971.1 cytochrome c-type biogenesis CcmH-like mitochondrial protein|eukprot:XP_024370967.1 cytochrome c-type biogenesis CcmH-like mitochondrial protein isoform X1 [Physcomitrella patens]